MCCPKYLILIKNGLKFNLSWFNMFMQPATNSKVYLVKSTAKWRLVSWHIKYFIPTEPPCLHYWEFLHKPSPKCTSNISRIRGFAFMRYINPRLIDWLINWLTDSHPQLQTILIHSSLPMRSQQNFRRTIPACGDILSQVGVTLLINGNLWQWSR